MAKRRSNKRNNYSKQNNKNNSTPLSANSSISEIDLNIDLSDPNYVINFAKAYLSQSNDPFIQNMILKDLNMNPRKIDRDKLIALMENPKQNEQALREFAQYIENTVMQFKRIILFFGSLLVFDHYIEPTNADEDDMKTPTFKKSHKKALNWLDRFNLKKQLPDIMRQVLRLDAVFYYVRESKDNIFLQEMPSKYCKIIDKTEYGYQYAFDMSYFFQMGSNIDNYAPEFSVHMDNYKSNDRAYQSKYPFWVDLNPLQAPCFKFDETVAGVVPPFMGLFPDVIDISTYRDLTKAKGELDVYKILLNKIPMHGGDGKTRKASDFAMTAPDAGKFSKIMEERVPDKKYFKVMTTPFDSELHDMQRSESGNTETDIGNDLFYNSASLNQNILGGNATTASGINASLSNAKTFVIHMYPVFERFINAHLKLATGRYRWKIHLEGTEHDRKDRIDQAFKVAGAGFPKTWLASAMGKNPEELVNMTNFENSTNLVSLLIPLSSSHTQSGDLENGRPPSDSIGDAGEKTKDADANVR